MGGVREACVGCAGCVCGVWGGYGGRKERVSLAPLAPDTLVNPDTCLALLSCYLSRQDFLSVPLEYPKLANA